MPNFIFKICFFIRYYEHNIGCFYKSQGVIILQLHAFAAVKMLEFRMLEFLQL